MALRTPIFRKCRSTRWFPSSLGSWPERTVKNALMPGLRELKAKTLRMIPMLASFWIVSSLPPTF